jgi:hypothetical protein
MARTLSLSLLGCRCDAIEMVRFELFIAGEQMSGRGVVDWLPLCATTCGE